MEYPVWVRAVFDGAATYAGAAAYRPSIAGDLSPFWFSAVTGTLLLGVLLSVAYWTAPHRAKAAALITAQLLVLGANSIARQWVQVSEIMKWYDPYQSPVRGEWGGFAFFVAILLLAVILMSWIVKVALRCARPSV